MRIERDETAEDAAEAVNPADPRLPPEAPMQMAAQALRPAAERRRARLRGFLPWSGQAG